MIVSRCTSPAQNTRYAQALTRSLLLALGLDHVLIDLLACSLVGAAKVLLAILFVPSASHAGLRTLPSHSPQNYDDRPNGRSV